MKRFKEEHKNKIIIMIVDEKNPLCYQERHEKKNDKNDMPQPSLALNESVGFAFAKKDT